MYCGGRWHESAPARPEYLRPAEGGGIIGESAGGWGWERFEVGRQVLDHPGIGVRPAQARSKGLVDLVGEPWELARPGERSRRRDSEQGRRVLGLRRSPRHPAYRSLNHWCDPCCDSLRRLHPAVEGPAAVKKQGLASLGRGPDGVRTAELDRGDEREVGNVQHRKGVGHGGGGHDDLSGRVEGERDGASADRDHPEPLIVTERKQVGRINGQTALGPVVFKDLMVRPRPR